MSNFFSLITPIFLGTFFVITTEFLMWKCSIIFLAAIEAIESVHSRYIWITIISTKFPHFCTLSFTNTFHTAIFSVWAMAHARIATYRAYVFVLHKPHYTLL